ncbi:MAG: hypothetical protein WCW63_02560 [Acholeplasmataceae bacterium]|jgi:hypothetical protein
MEYTICAKFNNKTHFVTGIEIKGNSINYKWNIKDKHFAIHFADYEFITYLCNFLNNVTPMDLNNMKPAFITEVYEETRN